MTPHGFIDDTDKALKDYKDSRKEWSRNLGGGDFAIVEEVDTFEPAEAYVQEPE
jgi:hypothetical protein